MDIRAALLKAGQCAFWLSVPLALAAILFWPRRSVIYVGDDPFSLELNPVRSVLPPPLDELWFFYPATLLGVAVVALCTIVASTSGTRYEARPARLPMFFLPAYLAGIESIGLLEWSMRCHSFTAPPSPEEVIANAGILAGVAFSIAIMAGALAARRFGHRSRLALPVPGVVVPIVGGVALPWWALWQIVQPR